MATRRPGWDPGVEDSIFAALARVLDTDPDRLFLDFSGDRYTYADVERESTRLALGLLGLGVSAGDRVVSVLDNNVDAVLTAWAVQRIGAVHVPINTSYKGEFLRHQIADSGAGVVIAETDYAARVIAVESGTPDVTMLLHRGAAPQSTSRLQVEPLDGYRIDGGELSARCSPQSLAALIYTSGTTGPSKGCMISQNYQMHAGRSINSMTDRAPDELNWTPLPLFHLNAVATLAGILAVGASMSIAPRFSLTGFWPEIQRTGARIVNLIGTMIPFVAQMDDTPEMLACKGQIRTVFGAPFSPEVAKIWHERFGVERVGSAVYGLTEGCVIVTSKIGEGKPGTSGRCNDEFDVRIFDDNDHEVGPGVVGEIVCRPNRPRIMFDGYWQRPESTVAQMRNQWFHTGDLGKFDEDGWFVFVDRKKDYLRRRGENISSFELEMALMRHEAVAEVAVHAVPSEAAEDEVKLTVVRQPGVSLTEEELCRWTIDNLPYFAVPRYIEFRSELPKNPVGRTLKYQLRDEGVTSSTWDRETAGISFTKR